MYLFQVKSPEESKEPWDYYKLVQVIPGDQAFQSLEQSRCPFITKKK
jgi:branched-chain amino acid transport system substrate-binding protein